LHVLHHRFSEVVAGHVEDATLLIEVLLPGTKGQVLHRGKVNRRGAPVMGAGVGATGAGLQAADGHRVTGLVAQAKSDSNYLADARVGRRKVNVAYDHQVTRALWRGG